MLLVELPLFARTGLGVDMEVITLMSSLPFLANWVWSLVYSRILDHLRSQGSLSTLAARRLSVLVSSVLPGLSLLLIIIIGDNILGVVLLTTLAVMFYGSMFSGIINNNDTCSVIAIGSYNISLNRSICINVHRCLHDFAKSTNFHTFSCLHFRKRQ